MKYSIDCDSFLTRNELEIILIMKQVINIFMSYGLYNKQLKT